MAHEKGRRQAPSRYPQDQPHILEREAQTSEPEQRTAQRGKGNGAGKAHVKRKQRGNGADHHDSRT